jgi:GDP-4-dehydro-6-deoxy-D-mannose reductase
MRVLVTGIEGFVGSHAAEFLLGIPGVEVHGTVFDLARCENIAHLRSSLHLHQTDILDAERVNELVSDVRPARILHLAGQAYVPNSLTDPVGTFRVNILGGVHILQAAAKLRQQQREDPAVMIVSTGEVYGRVAAERQPITEEVPIGPNNPYAASKASIDLIAQQYSESFGLKVTVVRPFNHVGPRQSPIFVCSDFGKQFAEIAFGHRKPEMLVGNLEARRDFTDVRDVVGAYWMLFERATQDVVFNVCSGHPVQIREILGMYEELSGVNVNIVQQQERLRSYDVPIVVGSYDRLRRATGWTPAVPLRKTLEDVFAYWKMAVMEQR